MNEFEFRTLSADLITLAVKISLRWGSAEQPHRRQY